MEDPNNAMNPPEPGIYDVRSGSDRNQPRGHAVFGVVSSAGYQRWCTSGRIFAS